MMRFWTRSLLARLASSFFLLALLIVCVVGTIAYLRARAALTQSVINHLSLIARIKEEELNRWIEEQRQDVLLLAETPEMQEQAIRLLTYPEQGPQHQGAYEFLSAYLDTVSKRAPDLQEIFILSDPGAQIVFSTVRANEGQYRPSDNYFVSGRERTVVENVYPSPLTGRPTITIATPLYATNRVRVGVLAAHINLDRMDTIILERAGLGETGEAYLVDKVNVFVSADRFGREDYPRGVHSAGIDRAVQGADGTELYTNYRGEAVIGAYRWIEERDLALLVELHQAEAFSPARQLAWTIFLVGLVAAIVLAAGVYLLARRITQPILAITDTARQIAAGDLSGRAPITTSDEIGVLARTFNQMTEQLRGLYNKIQQSEAYFRSLIEHALDIIVIINADGAIRYGSPSVERVLGYTQAEFDGKHVAEFIHTSDVPRVMNALMHAREQADTTVRPLEYRVRHRDGTWHTLEAIGNNLLGDPVMNGIVLNCRDITYRKQAEEALRASESKIRALLDAIPDTMLRVNREGIFLEFIAGRHTKLLVSPGDYVGRHINETLPPHVAEQSMYYLEQALSTGAMQVFEYQITLQGKVLEYEARMVVSGEDEVLAIVRDMTRRRQLEEQVLHLQRMETVGTLAGGIAHDFNNMLSIILGYAELARENCPADSPLAQDLHEITKVAERAAMLTRQLLAFSRRQLFELRVVNLNTVITELDKMLQQIIGQHIELQLVLDSDIPNIRVDTSQMEQVLLNLCLNARDAMAQGGRLIIETRSCYLDADYCRRHAGTRPGPYVQLAVSDNGTGMSKEVQSRIFEPFFTTKELGRGTGLGLSVVYGIVHQHGGFINVYSEEGYGTSFKIYLPITSQQISAEIAPLPPVKGGGETILIAEDEVALRGLAADMLRRLGYTILLAANGEEAVQIFIEHAAEIDMVLMDVVMPRCDGWTAFEQMQRISPNLKVLFATGYSSATIRTSLITEPQVDVIQKPYSFDSLARRVRSILDRPTGVQLQDTEETEQGYPDR